MSRVQLALNVPDIDAGAWEIYTVLEDSHAFGQSSAKVDDQTGDSLCCSSVPEAEARCR